MRKLSFVIFAAIAFLSIGCNTIKGIGQDLERGGEAIQKATK